MIVKVGAARREWAEIAIIYDEAFTESQTQTTPSGGCQISFVASGIHGRDRDSSQYRYTVILSSEELAMLVSQHEKPFSA
ncbi:hypothetical protein ACWF50_11585 [Brucella pseudogrignonensis]|jgi:hypothetical protein